MLHQRTEFAGGQGLIILTSFQLKKAFQPALAQLKSGQKREGKGWRDVTPADFEELLQPGNIEMYSGAAKYFDMLWGVAARDERMSGGLITCARVRSSRKFSPVWFEVDADSHYAFERVASTEMLIPEFD